MTGPKAVFIFGSIHHVLRAEKVLKKEGLDFELVPVPKEVNPDCGMAVEAEPGGGPVLLRALSRAGLTPEAMYLVENKIYTAVDVLPST